MKNERPRFKVETANYEGRDVHTIVFEDGGERPATAVEAVLWDWLWATGVLADVAREWLEAADEYTKVRAFSDPTTGKGRAEGQLKYVAAREAFRQALTEWEKK